MQLDAAILRALKLDPAKTRVSTHGGSGFSSTIRISTTLEDGTSKQFFGKTAPGKDAATMFEGEYASLNAIHNAVPSLCPAALAHGPLDDAQGSHFLVTDFLDMTSRSAGGSKEAGEGSGMSLAQKLGKLHSTPAPVPERYEKPIFGFPVTTCCGDTPQTNSYRESWAEFYGENRLLAILERSEKNNGKDGELRKLVEGTVRSIVPRLIGDGHLNGGKGITPVVVHGDLWSGNKGRARIAGVGAVEDVVFDPSACWAHSEFELGIMKMFGGFGGSFLREYHQICPKTEPVEEYEDRVSLYEL